VSDPAVAADRSAGADAGHVAVIDVGSNSIRIVLYDRLCRAPVPRFNEKALCALGRDLEGGGRLDPEAAVCALGALGRFVRLAGALDAARLRIVATEALRRASDGAAFLAEAERRLGRPITVLGGDDEARLAALGVAGGFWRPGGIVGDLGGGSVELAVVGPDGVGETRVSLPLGTLRLQPATARNPATALARIDAALDRVPWLAGAARGGSFYAVGGSWRALARVHLAMAEAPLQVVNGHAVDADEACRLVRHIGGLEPRAVERLPGLPSRRGETLPAAAQLMERLLDRLRPERVVFSALGLREGLLFEALGPAELAKDPLVAGARDLGRARSRTTGIGEAMAAWTAPLFRDEPAEAARLRLATCAVADVGWLETRDSRARDAFFMLAHYPFLGADHADRVAIAYAVALRYEGRPDDRPLRPLLALLRPEQRRRAEMLGQALDVGFRLCGGAPRLLAGSRLELGEGELRLEVPDAGLVPEVDVLGDRLEGLARSLGLGRARILISGEPA
jgi:exopolyphosphatase/guanosine-5'-triphosphate,3'-diphosphate pyrophosphatase